jgi:CHAT domain-containing protein
VNLVNAGDELMGLLGGFIAAGARAILASLWRVDDQITREFMSSFYGSLHTVQPAAALRRAQQQIMKTQPHPAFWAPFVLAGGD